MRLALLIVSLCLLLALGARGLDVNHAPQEVARVGTDSAAPMVRNASEQTPQGPQNPGDEVLARMDSMAREIDSLRIQVAALRAGAEREPAIVVAEPVDGIAASGAALPRDKILQVIEEDRLAQQRKRDEDQRARDLAAMLTRAERTAKKFGLDARQEKSLADVYILERQKMEDFRTQMREQGGFGADPEQMRQSFQDLRTWRLDELTSRLGSDLANQINESENDRFGGGPGGRRGNRGQGGQGGGDGGNGGGGF
jgi:hypothetical protein